MRKLYIEETIWLGYKLIKNFMINNKVLKRLYDKIII